MDQTPIMSTTCTWILRPAGATCSSPSSGITTCRQSACPGGSTTSWGASLTAFTEITAQGEDDHSNQNIIHLVV